MNRLFQVVWLIFVDFLKLWVPTRKWILKAYQKRKSSSWEWKLPSIDEWPNPGESKEKYEHDAFDFIIESSEGQWLWDLTLSENTFPWDVITKKMNKHLNITLESKDYLKEYSKYITGVDWFKKYIVDNESLELS